MDSIQFHLTQFGVRVGGDVRVVLSGLSPEVAETRVLLEPGYTRRRHSGSTPHGWTSERFPWPFDPLVGIAEDQRSGESVAEIVCRRAETRWGVYWTGSLPRDTESGLYHLEVEDGSHASMPFEVGDWIYDRILAGYLDYLRAQRAGDVVPGCRSPLFLDDAVSDVDGRRVIGVGGWFDAGDHRQWTSTTALHLGALTELALGGPAQWRPRVLEELEWGQAYFTHLAVDGVVPDNIGGGAVPAEYQDQDWWFENHSGTACDGSGSHPTDDIPGTGDERIATMTSNPHAENVLARELALSWHAGGSPVAAARARAVAERVWERSAATPHDRRTLFAASRLRAAVALHRLPRPIVEVAEIRALTKDMLARQYRRTGGEVLAGYFLECPGGREPFRSIPYSCEPALALLDASTVLPEPDSIRARAAVADYIDSYLLADARSNPFGLPPYGVYHLHDSDPRQAFREVSTGYGARTFMAPWNPQSIVHGTGAVVMHQCYLLARAAAELGRSDWADASDRILQWATGANPQCMSLFLSLGYRHPVPFSPRYPNLPGAVINGHIGRLDDSPYLEESNAVNWNTQEVYGVPTTYAAQAALWASGRIVAPLRRSTDGDERWL